MAPKHVQVFSQDPILATYLASYLNDESCNIQNEEGNFYLCSSYFEAIPLSTIAKRTQHFTGLASILDDLMSFDFDALSYDQQKEACIHALLFLFNGALKLKYKNCGSLTRQKVAPPTVLEQGHDYEEDDTGKHIYISGNSVAARFVLSAGKDFYEQADNAQPSLKQIWNIARRNASVARALYHYEKSEDIIELRKVLEELMKDTNTGPLTNKGTVPFKEWNYRQRWSEQEIPAIKMDEAYALLHNAHLFGEQALHSLAFADRSQANTFTASGPIMPLSEARDIMHTALIKWIKSK